MSLTYRLALSALMALFVLPTPAQEAPQMTLPVVQLQAGMHNIRAQVATTADQRATGLMHRREMAQHEGMLFVFEQPSVQCFWMKNTLLPLSIAFLADDGTVVNVREMQPRSLDSTCSDKPVRYVLEMNKGWFDKRGVKPGTRLAGELFKAAK
jgi:uncharacterized membrane protein (UPF0127 family)